VTKETPIVILSDNETTADLLNNEAIAKTISVRYVIVGLGINDILFSAFPFTAPSEKVNAGDIISGYRQLIARGHRKRIRVIGATNPPFENSAFEGLVAAFYSSEREAVRQKVNAWIRSSGIWVGHGSGSADRDVMDKNGRIRVPPGEESYFLRPVWLSEDEESGYYYGLSNEGLWPLCHVAHARPVFRTEDWKQYHAVNQKCRRRLPGDRFGRPDRPCAGLSLCSRAPNDS
jgi:hypothetical protein